MPVRGPVLLRGIIFQLASIFDYFSSMSYSPGAEIVFKWSNVLW